MISSVQPECASSCWPTWPGGVCRPAVAVGGVEEVDAELVRVVHDHVGVGRRGQRPEVHGAEAQPADGQAGTAQVDVFHAPKPFTAPRPGSSGAWPPAPASRRRPSSSGAARPGPRSRTGGRRTATRRTRRAAPGARPAARASARQDEVRNHSAQGASSLPSTCRCQPDAPPCVVSRGGCARPASRALIRSAAVPASPAANTSAQPDGGLPQPVEIGVGDLDRLRLAVRPQHLGQRGALAGTARPGNRGLPGAARWRACPRPGARRRARCRRARLPGWS